MDSGRRSHMSDMTNEEDFYPGESLGNFESSSEPVESRKSKAAKKIKRNKVAETDENDFNIRDEIIGFLRSKIY